MEKIKKTTKLLVKAKTAVFNIVQLAVKPKVFFSRFFEEIKNLDYPKVKLFLRRNFPLVLAIAFLTPAFILLFLFVNSRIHRQQTQAGPPPGAVKVSKQSTTLSTDSGWLDAMAFSGDGVNGDGDYFQPIHPGTRSTTEGAAGTLAVGEVVMPTTTTSNYDAGGAQFIPWKPDANGDFYGVTLAVANLNTTAANLNVVVEVLRFPTASYGPPWTNYVACTALNTCTYPANTVIERTQVMRFDQSISGEAAYPGNYGIHYMDFRFDPPLPVLTTGHYGFRVYYNSLTTFPTWPRNRLAGATKMIANAINFGLGIANIDTNDAGTVTIPMANTGNADSPSGVMVAANSAPAVGQAAAARTQNEHWTGTYDDGAGNWTIASTAPGASTVTYTNKFTSATTGGTGASWVNDGVTMTTLSTDATASTKLCVNSITGFATNQNIDIWDSDTASIARTIASTNGDDGSCGSRKSITVTATLAATDVFTISKNATVARATWKLRIIQGAEETITQVIDTTRFCVADGSQFSLATGGASNINIWDDDTIIVARQITGITTPGSCTNPSDEQITVNTSLAGAYTVANHAHVAELATNFSNSGTPGDGDVFRFTSLNMSQNPAKIGNGNSFLLLYGKSAAPATSAVNYPNLTFLRHPFYVAYGEYDTGNTAPVDNDLVIVGSGAADPDPNDSTNLDNDLLLGNISPHTVTVDKDFNMPLVYTGATGAGVNNGLTTPATASNGGSGFVSMLVTTRAKLAVSDTASQRYRLTAPGKILLSSGASLELGSATDPLPQSTSVDLYEDSSGPDLSTNFAGGFSTNGTNTYIDVISTTGFYIGDVVMVKDNNTVPRTYIIASINTGTNRITFTAAPATGYAQVDGGTVSRGPSTIIPTGADRRSQIYSARLQAARVNMYSQGSDSYRTPQADLAVDIDGNIDTGYLGAQQTVVGNTWADVSGTLAGNWSALDPISVAQGNSYAVNNWDSSLNMGANDDASVFPTWTGVGTLGLNAAAIYNPENTEIGTIPLTNIYNADYNGGGGVGYSSNYQTSNAWTLFDSNVGDIEEEDAVYFGDQGNTPIYALEFNVGTAIDAVATRVWEYYKSGDGWTEFTPKFGWKNVPRGTNNYGIGEYCVPFNANPVFPTNIIQVTDSNTLFAPGQFVKIKDTDSPTIIRRISAVTAAAPGNITFTEVIPDGYTTPTAQICIPNGGQWQPMEPDDLFTQTGKTLISWSAEDTPSAEKFAVNGATAYWVRNRIDVLTSWTTSPTNQTTPVEMQGVETISSYPFTVFNSVNEAKFNHLSKGDDFDPNETWTLRYNDNSTSLPAVNLKTTRWYESQLTSWGTAHRWRSPNDVGNTTAYYEKNVAEVAATNWRTLNGGFNWTDYNVTSKIYFGSAKASNVRIGHFLRQNADDYGYALYISPAAASTVMQFYTIANGAETAIAAGSYTIPTFNIRTWYCLKTQVTTSGADNLLKAKFWTPTSPTAACSDNEPVGWSGDKLEVTHTPSAALAYLYSAGRFGLAADTALTRFDDVVVKNSAETETWFTDNFNDTGCWRVIGSIHGDQGCAYNSIPFVDNYINFTLKHKGGVQSGETGANAVVGPLNAPEQGDEIYISPVMRGSPIGLDETKGIDTDDDETKYENWDFVYNSDDSKWDVTGSQYGSAGQATPDADYNSPGGEISLKIKTGTPATPKFGDRAAYFQNSYQRGNGNSAGLNGHSSAIIIQPTWAVTGSATGYNIEGAGGVADQKGTIDFWFKPNFSGSPPYIQYLFDYAANSNSERLSVRMNPNGKLEFVVWSGAAMGATVTQTFNPTAGQWYHFRGAWEDTGTVKAYAWLDGDTFETNHALTIAARGANAGYMRLGNSWQYNAGFDGAIDEFAIFDDAVDASADPQPAWGNFTPPALAWTNAQQIAGRDGATNTIIFLAHFNDAFEKQKGTMMADYFVGHPVMAFTNGVDTLTGDRIRVTTYPQRTRLWVDNTGSQYTPAARIKYSEGYNIGTAPGTEIGWMNGFQYHHRAASDNENYPISSPVLNLRKQIRIWSDEDINVANGTAPVNQGYGTFFYWPKEMNVNHLELSQLYYGFYLRYNPYTTITPYPTQYIRKSAFNNVQYQNIYTLNKTLGSQVFDANNFAALGNTSYPLQEDSSANITFSNNYTTGYSGNYSAYLNGGRVFTLSGNKIFNVYYPVYLAAGTAKVNLSNNEFWRYQYGLTLNGNSFVTMSGNSFDGGVSTSANNGYYGTGIYVAPNTTNVEVTDSNSTFGKSIWNEADVAMPPDTSSWLAGSLLRYIGENSSFNSNFHYLGLSSQDKFGGEYLTTAIPGVDVRMGYGKDIVNYTNFGLMRTTGADLIDETVKTAGGYGWRMESTSKTDALEYTAKVVGVSGKPLAVTGYVRINDDYGTANLPTVTLSGLGMTGPNLTWTAAATTDTWQQFVVSGTPTESALATVMLSVKSEPTLADSGTAENVDDGQGINLPTFIEDGDKSWTWNYWTGYKMRDDQGFIFDIIGNTATRLFLKGTRIPFANTLPTQPYGAAYEIYSPPYVYLDDVSVLSGTVDTGTLDFHSQGQPVSPWLATGLTAEGVWSAQYSSFSDITGSFGQLMQDALIARYADVSDISPTATEFDTNLPDSSDDFYNDGVIIFTEGANKGVIRRISDYVNSNGTITVDPALPSAPADGDRFAVLAATSASTGSGGATPAEIWTYTLRQLTTADLDDEGTGSLATADDVANIRADIADVLTELGTGNISAIRTATNTINWANVTGLVTTAGEIKDKTDDINWNDITTIQTNTGDIDWGDITAIKLKTDTITWGDITDIKSSVATLILEIGTDNISAIKTSTDTINWTNITGIVTSTGLIKNKTDTIDWANVTGIKTKTDTIDWNNVTGIKTKTDTIAWGDITNIQSSINSLNNITAESVWAVGVKQITGVTTAGAKDIWDSACLILNESGSVGKKVCDNLDALVSSRSTLTAAQVWEETTKTITGLSDPALAAVGSAVWANGTKTLTDYGNDITAQNVWDVLTSSLFAVDSIGELLVANVDEEISTRASQDSLDDVATNVSDIESNVDVPVSSRASQESLDTHESAESAFRSSTTSALSELTINVGEIASQLSTIETKIDTVNSTLTTIDSEIDTIDTNLDSVKTTVEDTNVRVRAIQTVTNSILSKWGSYSAADIIGYIDVLEDYVGTPDDEATAETLFGRVKEVKEAAGSGGTVDLIYSQVQATHEKLVDVQMELGFNGKSTSAYDEIAAVKNYVDTVEGSLSTLDDRTTSIASSVNDVSDDLETVTDRIGKVSVDSFIQLFEVKKSDIDYLKNKMIELKAVADIDRQLLEQTINQPVVKVLMEWGSVIIKFVIVNPSDSTDQKIPFKAFLPKEVRQEYIIDLGGLNINYDATTEQYYVSTDIALRAGESVTRAVEIKDIWVISQDEVDSARKQAEEIAAGLDDTSYNAQALTLKTDINTRLDKVARKQKDNSATPQDHILAYRENLEEMKAVQENIKGMKDLILNSGTGKNFLASIGGIQTFATWGIVLVLIFGMGALGFFYYALWRKKVVSVASSAEGESETSAPAASEISPIPAQTVELPTPSPLKLPGFNLSWVKNIFVGLAVLTSDIAGLLVRICKAVAAKIVLVPKKVFIIVGGIILVAISVFAILKYIEHRKGISQEKNSVSQEIAPQVESADSERDRKVAEAVSAIEKKAKEKAKSTEDVNEIIKQNSAENQVESVARENATETVVETENKLIIKETPTGWLNVRKESSAEGEIVGKVYPNEEYKYLETQNGWHKIVLKDQNEGWINGEYAELKDGTLGESKAPDTAKKIAVADSGETKLTVKETPTGWLNVREQPTIEGGLVNKIYPGESYGYTETKDGWYKIALKDGKTGWVIGDYVKLESGSSGGNNIGYNKEVLGASISNDQTVVVKQTSLVSVNAYESPSYMSDVVAKVYAGEVYPSSEMIGGWYKIKLDDGREGWVLGEFLRLDSTEGGKFVEISPSDGSYINIRENPRIGARVVKKVYFTNRYPLIEEKDGWLKMETLEGNYGWVSKEFAKIINR